MKLHYDEEGDGPLVVLLHGFPEFRISWKQQLPALARAGFRAVAPDLRGYGESPAPPGIDAYRVNEIATDVAELIESLGGAPCVVVGHDWGAGTAWRLAMMRPDLVRRLAILNVPHPAAIMREVRRSFRQKVKLFYQLFCQLPGLPEIAFRLLGRTIMKRMGNFTKEEIDVYQRHWRTHLTPMLNYYRALPRSRAAAGTSSRRIEMPVLLIWGEREPVFLASALEGMEEWVPDVRIERIPGVGHFVQHDAPERVNELLTTFARG